MEVLKSMGLDPDLLSEKDIAGMEKMISEMKLPSNPANIDPNQILSGMRKAGIDVEKIIKKMRGNVQPKKSSRIKRNDQCPCKSGKKFKKCCWQVGKST